MNNEKFRVTSVNYKSKEYTIFSGVPLKTDSYKINSGKYIVSVKTTVQRLPVTPSIGQHWNVTGEPEYSEIISQGYRLKQHTYVNPAYVYCSLPETGEQLISFIAKEKDFKGIGESKARALWDRFGLDFHNIVCKDTLESRKLLGEHLSCSSIDALFEGYAKYANLSACNEMSKYNIPSTIQQRLLKFHGKETLEAICVNPYALVTFGMSFRDVDVIASTICDIKKNDTKRLVAALEMAIRQQIEKGHTYTSRRNIKAYIRTLLKDKELCEQVFKIGYQKGRYVINHENCTYHPTAQLLMESAVAKRLLSLVGQNYLYDTDANEAYETAVNDLPYQLTPMQAKAVVVCLENSVSCITGGAGTGKTTVLRTALRAYHEMGFEIYAVAISGRAAMRLHESIGFQTSTIAKLLKNEPIEPNNKYPKNLLVIDEASMIDLPTMYRVVTHIHPSVRIIFSGDPDQLPPIGCGKVLDDVIKSEMVANTTLDIVKRQDGSTGIPEYSQLINKGVVPVQLTTGNIYFHETTKEDVTQFCTDLYQQFPVNSCIIAPTKKLVADINKLTQEAINADGALLEFKMHGELRYDTLICVKEMSYCLLRTYTMRVFKTEL